MGTISNEDQTPKMGMQGLLGLSVPMQRVYKLIHIASAYRYPILISGEIGTGKEVAASVLHSLGPRRSKPFIAVDRTLCASDEIEAKLFGRHVPLFSEGSETQPGLMGAAWGGAVYFDEIGGLSPSVQAKLLRAMEQHEFWPIGSVSAVPFNARIIGATNRELAAEVTGKFREDLYFQLNALQIRMPALRERRIDIPILVDSMLCQNAGRDSEVEISAKAMDRLLTHGWPGNIPELESTVRRALACASGPMIQVNDLGLASPACESADSSVPLTKEALEFERRVIVGALQISSGDPITAANILGIGRAALGRRMRFCRLDNWL